MTNELQHYGVPGMKWGVRKEQYDKLSDRQKRMLKGYATMAKQVVAIVNDRRYHTENNKFKTQYRKDYLAWGERVKERAVDDFWYNRIMEKKIALEKLIRMKIDTLSAAREARGMRETDKALAKIGSIELEEAIIDLSSREKHKLFVKGQKEYARLNRYAKKDAKRYKRILK